MLISHEAANLPTYLPRRTTVYHTQVSFGAKKRETSCSLVVKSVLGQNDYMYESNYWPCGLIYWRLGCLL